MSWNVNGLRACARKGFLQTLEASRADIVAVQEVRATAAQLPPEVREPPGWHTHFVNARKAGYSGVGLFSRVPFDAVETSLGNADFDDEGRLQVARIGKLTIANAYFPKGSGSARDNSRVPYKLDFYRAVHEVLTPRRRRGPVLVVGDFNTAHTELDLARPKDNHKTSGFLPEERDEFTRWLANGWIDVFRQQHANQHDHYTWWRQWGGARENNVGWRIDYVLASASAARRVTDSFIWPQITGSDHCPVGVDLELS